MHTKHLWFSGVCGGFGFYPYDSKLLFVELVKQGYWFQNPDRDFTLVEEQETIAEYIPEQIRYFNIASPGDFDAVGGLCTWLRNLCKANEEFRLIDNFYTLCPFTVYIPKGAPVNKSRSELIIPINYRSRIITRLRKGWSMSCI